MQCKHCGREIPENSLYCNWCGERQIKERKKRGEVTVPKPRQLPSGKWFIQLRLGGKSISVTEETEELCVTKARAYKSGIIEAEKKLPDITVQQTIEKYIKDNAARLSPATLRGYDIILRNRFQSIQDKPVKNIQNWQAIINAEAELCSPKTLRNAWGLLQSSCKASGISLPEVKLPKAQKSTRPYFTPEEILKFIAAIEGTPVEIPALLGLHSLRRSEIAALKWEHVDLKNNVIHVRGAAVPQPGGQLVYKDTGKTSASLRDIPIMIPRLVPVLEAVQDKTGLVVTTMHPYNYRKAINAACRGAGLPEVGVHGLRHSFASLAFHLGIPAEIAMTIGGWDDRKTMADVYTHLYKADIAQGENAMAEFYKNANKNANGT